jgi:hypothetical protein
VALDLFLFRKHDWGRSNENQMPVEARWKKLFKHQLSKSEEYDIVREEKLEGRKG